jgi:hypothetical protein
MHSCILCYGALISKIAPGLSGGFFSEKINNFIAIGTLACPEPHQYELSAKLRPAFPATSLLVLSENTSTCRYYGFSSHQRPIIGYHIYNEKSRLFKSN